MYQYGRICTQRSKRRINKSIVEVEKEILRVTQQVLTTVCDNKLRQKIKKIKKNILQPSQFSVRKNTSTLKREVAEHAGMEQQHNSMELSRIAWYNIAIAYLGT